MRYLVCHYAVSHSIWKDLKVEDIHGEWMFRDELDEAVFRGRRVSRTTSDSILLQRKPYCTSAGTLQPGCLTSYIPAV